MPELSQNDILFTAYPNIETSRQQNKYLYWILGNCYIGGVKFEKKEEKQIAGNLLAWDSTGKVIFRGGLDYVNGACVIGHYGGNIQLAREHTGHRIGRKMVVAGLESMREYALQEQLPINKTLMRTQPGSSMGKIADYLGMKLDKTGDDGIGEYSLNGLPDLQNKLQELNLSKIK